MIKLKMLTVGKNLSRKPGRNVKLLKKSTLKLKNSITFFFLVYKDKKNAKDEEFPDIKHNDNQYQTFI